MSKENTCKWRESVVYYLSEFHYPGVAQLVARMVRVHEAVGSNPATRTMRSVLIGSEYPTKDTPHFLLSKLGQRRFHRTAADPGCTGALPCAG